MGYNTGVCTIYFFLINDVIYFLFHVNLGWTVFKFQKRSRNQHISKSTPLIKFDSALIDRRFVNSRFDFKKTFLGSIRFA